MSVLTNILPTSVSFGFQSKWEWGGNSYALDSGARRRRQRRSRPVRIFQFDYSIRDIADARTIEKTFDDARGTTNTFLIKDYMHFQLAGQAVGLGDSPEIDYALFHTHGNTNPWTWPVRYIDAGTLVMKVDGVIASHGAVVVPADPDVGATVTMSSTPPVGAVITASVDYYFPVQLADENFSIEVTGPGGIYGIVRNLTLIEDIEA